MKNCSKCGNVGIRDNDTYCPKCGSRELVTWQPAVPPTGAPGGLSGGTAAVAGGVPASPWQRILAFLIDFALVTLLSLLDEVPILNFLIAILVFLYWVLRDVSGASIGKRILGLKVMSKSGQEATKFQCIVRNLAFALPAVALVIPYLGLLLDGGLDLIIMGVELIVLLATKNRLGDKIAGTMVIKSR